MAIKIASDMGIFRCLSKATSFVTCAELAAPTGADQVLVGIFVTIPSRSSVTNLGYKKGSCACLSPMGLLLSRVVVIFRLHWLSK